MNRFRPEVELLLRNAGWYPSRDVANRVKAWQEVLASPSGFAMTSAASDVLREFGGLHVKSSGAGAGFASADINFDPALAQGEEDRFSWFIPFRERKVFPLGEVSGGHLFLGIDQEGLCYVLMDDLYWERVPFLQAIEALLLGIRPV